MQAISTTFFRPASIALLAGVAWAALSPAAFAQRTWTGANSNAWGTDANWGGTLPTSSTALVFGSGTGSGGLLLNNNLTTGTGWNVNGITFQAGAPAFVIGDGTLTANAGNTFTLSNSITNSSTSLQTINTPFAVTGTQTLAMTAGGGDLRLDGNVSGIGGIRASGTGVLTLAGSNSYTGPTTSGTGATLRLANAHALGSTSTLTFNGGTVLNATGSPIASTASGAFNSNFTFGQAGDTSANNLSLLGSGTFNYVPAANTITLNGNGTTLTFASTWTAALNNSNRDLTINGAGNTFDLPTMRFDPQGTTGFAAVRFNGSANLSASRGIFTSGSLAANVHYLGTGTMTLSAASNYGKLGMFGNGTVRVTDADALPNTSITMGNQIAQRPVLINASGAPITNPASLVFGQAAEFTLGADGDTALNSMTFTGTAGSSFSAPTVVIRGSGVTYSVAGVFENPFAGVSSRTFTVNGPSNTFVIGGFSLKNSNAAVLTQTIAGDGTLDINGPLNDVGSTPVPTLTISGNVILRGTSTFTGTTVISGNFQAGKTASLYNSATSSWVPTRITVSTGGSLILNAGGDGEFTAADVATLLGNLSTSITNNGMRSGSRIGFDTSNAAGGVFEYSTSIANSTGTGSGAIGVLKTGINELLLTGVNTYTGATTISAGRLVVGPTGSVNTTSGISVSAGAAFDYNASTALTVGPSLLGNGIGNRATLGGVGTINAGLTLNDVGDTLSPGNSPGIMPFGTSQTWNSFTYLWETNNFVGTTAGTDFDQIAITGALNLTGGTGAYLLDITSLTAGNVAGDVGGFSDISRSWTILTTTGGISGFDANNWTLSTANFTSTPVATGTWSLSQQGNNLVLDFIVVPEPTAAALAGCGVLFLAWRFIAQRQRRPQHVER